MADNQPKSLIDAIKNVFNNPSIVKGAMLTPYEETTVQKTKEEKPKDENRNLIKKMFGF